jgi:hypothetical protein
MSQKCYDLLLSNFTLENIKYVYDGKLRTKAAQTVGNKANSGHADAAQKVATPGRSNEITATRLCIYK